MNYCAGIDLGSTTTKAVVIGEDGQLLGRGITNSRSNYVVACKVALGEALISAHFGLLEAGLERLGVTARDWAAWLGGLENRFREQQYLVHLDTLAEAIDAIMDREGGDTAMRLRSAVHSVLARMRDEVPELFAAGASRKSDFFRDLAGSRYMHHAEAEQGAGCAIFDPLAGFFDRAILEVENRPPKPGDFRARLQAALREGDETPPALARAIEEAANEELVEVRSIGTGYGRQTLPFPKDRIRSEILCHGFGAYALFARTRTVLDIGGQDTKAIQVDEHGIVTSFQMNDRCAAGCGRYLGYIADEMNLGLHELGPLACASSRPVRINSTCTVFAGAELRERLGLGERREDILAGLHRAIILRAMSLLARSGGIHDQFTFTGGVAKNSAAVNALSQLVRENYGDITINISPDSIYTGALGAALFAHREWRQDGGDQAEENRALLEEPIRAQ
jgi:benzoyl-CoA reductase subunit A